MVYPFFLVGQRGRKAMTTTTTTTCVDIDPDQIIVDDEGIGAECESGKRVCHFHLSQSNDAMGVEGKGKERKKELGPFALWLLT